MKTRRIAASLIILSDGSQHKRHVVELIDSRVVSCYPLEGELPHTEWYSGTVVITQEEVFLLTTLADGTQRRQRL